MSNEGLDESNGGVDEQEVMNYDVMSNEYVFYPTVLFGLLYQYVCRESTIWTVNEGIFRIKVLDRPATST